jgi:ribosomal protein S10
VSDPRVLREIMRIQLPEEVAIEMRVTTT